MALRYVLLAALILSCQVFPAEGQIRRLPHADSTRGNFFGISVAIDGNRVLVGASGENACGPNSGAAYVYEYEEQDDTWSKAGRLTATDCAPGDYFGRHVALSGDYAVIAAAETVLSPRAMNKAYVFERDTTGTWRQAARLMPEFEILEGGFATSVAIDGPRVLVTTSGDASTGAYHGAAYVFERNARTGLWERVARLTETGSTRYGVFGGVGVLSGDLLAVTASTYYRDQPGSVIVFARDMTSGAWRKEHRFLDMRDFFISIDLSDNRLLIGESRSGRRQSGRAQLFERLPSGHWRRQARLEPAYPYEFGAFGTLVALDGTRALVVGYDEQLGLSFNVDRVVYAYGLDPMSNIWQQRRLIDIGRAHFGTSIALCGNIALVGEASENDPGAVHVVHLP
jgi:hypothetical protein